MSRMVVIEHKDGRRVAVTPADYRRLYEAQGFTIVHWEEGEPYDVPAKKKDG